MLVSKAVDEFMFSLVNKSKHTKRAYRYALNLFPTWCHDYGVELETIKAGDVRRYTEWLQVERGLSVNVIHNNIITVKTLLDQDVLMHQVTRQGVSIDGLRRSYLRLC